MDKEKEYKCAMCKGVFETSCSDEEALKEMQDTFTVAYEKEDCEILCDDCYKRLMNGQAKAI